MTLHMIDMHSHIAWGIDDGMPTREDAIRSLRHAKQDGIDMICSTPHVVPGQTYQEELKAIFERQKEAWQLAREYDITLFPGAEMFMNSFFIESLEDKLYETINGTNYLLCEFDVTRDIHTYDESEREERLYEIKAHGMIPVIAHVERYFHHGIDYDIVDGWKKSGYIFQCNRTSLMGFNGRTIQQNAQELMDGGYYSMVVTDTHRSHAPREETLSDAYDFIEERYGKRTAQLLLAENPEAVLRGKDVTAVRGMRHGR